MPIDQTCVISRSTTLRSRDPARFNAPLADAEIDELDHFLLYEAVVENSMTLDMPDGYLHALAIGPTILRTAGLVMGYALLSTEAIEDGVRRLKTALNAVEGRVKKRIAEP